MQIIEQPENFQVKEVLDTIRLVCDISTFVCGHSQVQFFYEIAPMYADIENAS